MAISALTGLITLTRGFTVPSSSLNYLHYTTRFSFFVNVVSIDPQRETHRRRSCCKTMASSTPASSSSPEVNEDSKITAPYGSWKSAITADVVSGGEKRLGGIASDSLGHLFLLESRPNESGRSVLIKVPEKQGDEAIDITPKDFAVRSTAQEYGGGAFGIFGEAVIFSNYKDQRLYKQSITSGDALPVPITPDYGGPVVCYADGVFDSRFDRYVTVMEDHRESSLNPTTTIATISLNDNGIQEPKVLVGGNDFYAFPRVDPKGERMAWIEWGHPNMPWDKSELWVGYISENGDVYKRICVAGYDSTIVESPTEPKWSSKGELFFITDRKSGFWNLYKWNESNNEVLPVYSLDAEFARPLWVFGMNSYEFIQNNDKKNLIACSYRQNGRSYIGVIDDAQNSLSLLDTPFTDIQNITSGVCDLYIEGASAVHPLSVAKVSLDDQNAKVIDFKIMWSSSPESTKFASYFSLPELIKFPTEVPGEYAYAYYYSPSNPNYQASQEEQPPLLLKSHGGPTSETRGILNLSIQFWTSRGWAFVDVNYGGSTGYGREYRDRLLGRWGIVDVNDCCSCAKFLVDSGKVDSKRLCITGGSAGGYTTLAALAFKDTFSAGASLYGVADLSLLRAETHKFESHYIDNLVGNEKDYFERSPINFVDKFSCPIILFQGLDDKVVPPDQARKIYIALKEKGSPVALVEYEGEQHGFRKAENIKFTLEQQMVFFARVVGHFKHLTVSLLYLPVFNEKSLVCLTMKGRKRNHTDRVDLASGVSRDLPPSVNPPKTRAHFFSGETSAFGQNLIPSTNGGEVVLPPASEDVRAATSCSPAALPFNVTPSASTKLTSISARISGFATPQFSAPSSPFKLPVVVPCLHCFAKRFHGETLGFCCSNGDVFLISYPSPSELWRLFTSNDPDCIHFRTYVRTYNNKFAFTSFGVKYYDKELCKTNKGVYTFRAQGQVYHRIESLLPIDGLPSGLQLYFYDTEHELQNRMQACDRLHPDILALLMDIVSQNPFTCFFRTLADIPDLTDCRIIIHENAGLDQRVFNAPSASQVAAIWVESGSSTSHGRDIVVYNKAGLILYVKYYFGCYDPMQYPLLFALGESGWHEGIERPVRGRPVNHAQHDPLNIVNLSKSAEELLEKEMSVARNGRRKRSTISCREYYAYKLQIRPNERSVLLHSGRLLQQYVVDMYIKLESSRLDYFRLNQDSIRSELYKGIVDCLAVGEMRAGNVGQKFVLPATFIGGPRDMRRRYVDAMSLVQRFGKPDIFLTMTCNPAWPEITAELLPGELAQNRPDLVARIFRSKLEELKKDLLKRHIFGQVAAYVYVIEFQKRGLPHVHFLLIMKNGYKIESPDMYDKFVSAEIPKESENPHLRHAVWKHMMHGPCGTLNPTNVCMQKKGECKNHYPKDFCQKTTQRGDSYPIYRRRDNKEVLQVRGQLLDNRWVVPYSPYLLAKYDCHLNVEICSTIKAVKYLYKYIYKGHDQVSFRLGLLHDIDSFNEIKTFQDARWVSPPEAVWRIYRFLLNETSPSVLALQVHLENCQSLRFKSGSNLRQVADNPLAKKSMLTEYFFMNKTCPEARKFLYKQFPEHFVWHPTEKIWTLRKRDFSIGRLITVSPSEGERFYLRLLLGAVRGATSFDDLKCFNDIRYESFRDAAQAQGLLEDDNSQQLCMQESIRFKMPCEMRRTFAIIIVFANPINISKLWEQFEYSMIEDYMRIPSMTVRIARSKALGDISRHLQSMGKNIIDYHLPISDLPIDDNIVGFSEIEEELKIKTPEEDLLSIHLLNHDQQAAYDTIVQHALSNTPGVFFIDGPGGTGKTYLYRALLAKFRSEGYIALATASSGVAASILPGGRTAHSRFKIPLDADDTIGCKVKKQSGLAKLLKAAKLIVWDEAPMARKQAIEAFDRMLQDICDCKSDFGGKVVVFGGDFRQVLPVVLNGSVAKTIESSLIKSDLWPKLQKLKLKHNMRANQDSQFSELLLRVGDGKEKTINEDEIRLPEPMVIRQEEDNSLSKLLDATFPNIKNQSGSSDIYENRAILAPKNDNVEEINDILIGDFVGNEVTYYSFDTPMDQSQMGFQEDFFNTLTPSGYPPHVLRLKLNCPVMLLRNLDPSKGMCNGTRLICRAFSRNVILAEIASGNYKGNKILLPRIPIIPAPNESVPFAFKRTQFPIRLCFAMTINKAQGQTLDFVGIYLPRPVFSHGQLYVALSRARSSGSIKVLVVSPLLETSAPVMTRNVVYDQVLALASA